MDPNRHERITRLFLKTCNLEPEERARFLDDACGDDAELRAEVESLLVRDPGSEGASPTETRKKSAPSDKFGDPLSRVGPYRLLRKVGEGGMGEVWEAEQEEPVRRRVALKIIKWGMDTKQLVARFESERQALALMDHPGIAKVFDAGATEQGRPYFVMEYVEGVPITRYCDAHRLTTRERLELFQQVCEAVQHAHQKAVIHRDLKPSNVLVTEQDGRRQPKIIDFGVAKATAQKLTERTLFTEQGVLIGTPEYMSPEQAELTGEDVDTRTDVYSLGVILYELLVGALPFDPKELRSSGLEGIRKKIREGEPRRPSTRLSTLGDAATDSARARRVDQPTLQRELRGDLDWVTMRALEKDRPRRYGSPMELAADIGRHLAHEPVLASPPSTVYRAKKFVRRHRFGVLAAAVGVVALIGFAATMAVQARRIALERDRAEQANVDLESVVEFQAGMLSKMDTEGIGARLMEDLKHRIGEASRGRGLSEAEAEAAVRSFEDMARGVNATDAALRLIDEEILARAVETLKDKFGEQPLIEARLRETIGVTYRELGLYQAAEPELQDAVETHKRLLGDEHRDTLRSMYSLGRLYYTQGRYDEAEDLYVETLEAQRRVLGNDHPDTLWTMNSLAHVYSNRGRDDEAEALFLEALETRRRTLGDDHPDTLWSMNGLAGVYLNHGRYDKAEGLYFETLETRKRVLGDDHRQTLNSMGNLALLYKCQGRYDEAEALYIETLETRKRVMGDDHPDTLWSMNTLGVLYLDQGRYDEAEALHLETLETRERVLGDDHPDTLVSKVNLARVYSAQGRYDEAEGLYLETLETKKRTLGGDHPSTLITVDFLAYLYSAQGRSNEAEALILETLETKKRVFGDDHRLTLSSMDDLCWLYSGQGRYDKAQQVCLETLESRKRILGDDQVDTLNSMDRLAHVYTRQGLYEEAEALHLETLEHRRRVLGDDHQQTLRSMDNLGGLYTRMGRLDEAETLLQEALKQRRRVLAEDHADFGRSYYYLGCLAAVRGQRATALDFLRKAADLGWPERDILDDPALESLRGDPEFEVILPEVKKGRRG